MRPAVPDDLLAGAAQWAELHPWERSELGKALRRHGLSHGEIMEIIRSLGSRPCTGASPDSYPHPIAIVATGR